MGIVERRERERTELRRSILDAARELFASEGYEAVTMRRIAEAIEYSPTTIYNHFEDKEDVVKALCDEDFARLFEALSRTALPEDPVDRIRLLGRAYCAFAIEYPFHYRFMFLTPHKTHEIDEDNPGHRSFGLLRVEVERAIETGRLVAKDPDLVAQVLWASIHGAVSLLTTKQENEWPCPPSPELVEETIENSLRGFLAGPSRD